MKRVYLVRWPVLDGSCAGKIEIIFEGEFILSVWLFRSVQVQKGVGDINMFFYIWMHW